MQQKPENLHSFLQKKFQPQKEGNDKHLDIAYLKSMSVSSNECIYLYSLHHKNILFQKGFDKCLGYEKDVISFEFLFRNIHPDDREVVERVTKTAIVYSLDHPKDCIHNQLFITYRHQTKKGDYIKVLNQVTVFQVDKNGVIELLLIKLLNISFLETADIVNWTFKASGLDKSKFKDKVYKYTENIFTKREMELIHKMVKGLTNKQIGKQLNISEHTVSTHRKNILKKSNCHNFIELEIYCKGKGIL